MLFKSPIFPLKLSQKHQNIYIYKDKHFIALKNQSVDWAAEKGGQIEKKTRKNIYLTNTFKHGSDSQNSVLRDWDLT